MTNINNNHNRPISHHHHHHHLVPPPPPSSTSGRTTQTSARSSTSTTQACAACRYQRRKCAPDCILAPYFPHERQRQFQNAHKLFGVSNITKIIRDLDPPHKDEAMRTIIYQSDVRAHDPVGGCYRIIRDLQRQIDFSRAQLDIVLHHLAFCRSTTQAAQHHLHDHIFINDAAAAAAAVDVDSDINLYDHALHLDLAQITQQHQHQHHQHDQHDQHDPHDPHDPHDQHDHAGQYIIGGQINNGAVPLQDMNSWTNMNNSPQELKPPLDEPADDFKPLLINHIPAGERHDFKFEFDELNEPSEETLFSDANHKASTKDENMTFFTKEENVPYQQRNEDNDLKGAATLFTLTNCSSY